MGQVERDGHLGGVAAFVVAVLYVLYLDTMPRQFVAELERSPDHTHVVLITTGSVASIKAPLIVRELLQVSPHLVN